MTGGRKIVIDDAQLFLSSFHFESEGGQLVSPEQNYVLFKKFAVNHALGKIAVGKYYKLSFVSSLLDNYNDLPSSANAYLQDNSMWYDPINNTKKYIHIKITGSVDTTLSKNGLGMVPFNISLGAGAISTKLLFDNYYTEIVKDENAFIIINANFGTLFDNINMLDPANRMITTPGMAISRGQQFLLNIPNMFSIL